MLAMYARTVAKAAATNTARKSSPPVVCAPPPSTWTSTGAALGNSLQAPPSGKVSDGSALGLEHDCTVANPQDVASNLAIAGKT